MLMKPFAVHEHLFIKIVCASKHFLCDDIGEKHNVCEMGINYFIILLKLLFFENNNLIEETLLGLSSKIS